MRGSGRPLAGVTGIGSPESAPLDTGLLRALHRVIA